MNYASVCSGAEAFGPAWHQLGFEPVFHAEIEPHASAVLRYHYPTVPNYGDFTQIATENGAHPTRPVRLLCGGTPCQTFSVAGLREGLDSYKGNLTLEFVRLAKRLGVQWILWENVPGVLSADNGEAFGSFLGALAECGYGFAYRVLDLQHWGVPQRRKRVFVVGYLGDWRPAAAVLFERQSLLGNPKKGRKAGQDVAGTLSSRTNAGGGLGTDFDLAGGLQLAPTCYDENQVTSKTNRSNPAPGSVWHTLPASPTAPLLTSGVTAYGGGNTTGEINTATCLTTGNQRLDFDTETFLVQPAIAFTTEQTPKFNIEQALTLTKQSPTGGGQIQSVMQPQPFTEIADCLTSAYGTKWNGNASATNGSLFVNQPALVFQPRHYSDRARMGGEPSEVCHTLSASAGTGDASAHVAHKSAVRRLTPTECEALMGWKRNWTKYGINAKGKTYELADGPRYRICGNGWGAPVVTWIAKRIKMIDALMND